MILGQTLADRICSSSCTSFASLLGIFGNTQAWLASTRCANGSFDEAGTATLLGDMAKVALVRDSVTWRDDDLSIADFLLGRSARSVNRPVDGTWRRRARLRQTDYREATWPRTSERVFAAMISLAWPRPVALDLRNCIFFRMLAVVPSFSRRWAGIRPAEPMPALPLARP
jgi:hypothetical protein